jgi:putative endonuclease
VRSRTFYVYILAGQSGVLYTGVTNNLTRRLAEHRERRPASFTAKYNLTRLVYWEVFGSPSVAIRREKEIKGWLRTKKVTLVESKNPSWTDLSEGFR